MAGPPSTPSVLVARATSVAELGELLSDHDLSVLSFIGYSAAGYQDPQAMLECATKVLDLYTPVVTVVNIGATALGIGAVYAIARQKGFATIGIVSSLARSHRFALSPFVDKVFYVEDCVWGGLLPGSTQLSATSGAIVAHSTACVAIGGGLIVAVELQAMRDAGKAVQFIAADMNHALACDRATRKNQPAPVDFRGAAHAVWFGCT